MANQSFTIESRGSQSRRRKVVEERCRRLAGKWLGQYRPGMEATKTAFDRFRLNHPLKKLDPARVANPEQLLPMTEADGALSWKDGSGSRIFMSESDRVPPPVSQERKQHAHLWVVMRDDVRHAPERCAFGQALPTGMIKHSNLTAGAPAHCGGELLFEGKDTIIVNGDSGRYGPRTPEELQAVAMAFRGSGYRVWSMGWDTDAGKPMLFVGARPMLVE